MHTLFLSCLKATELIEKKLQFNLSFRERLQLKVHKMMCKACTNYEKQSSLIDQGISKSLSNKDISHTDIKELKTLINKKLNEQ